MSSEIIVTTSSGKISGRGGYSFLGIPYGEAGRFLPPRPVSWTGIRECRAYGSRSAQPNFLGLWPEGKKFRLIGGEDCLNLNVWTPALDPQAKLPVVIYVHGGAFQVGGNDDPLRAGDRFMGAEKMVFVSVNYRLGVLGGLCLGELLGEKYASSGNCAALDLLLAVRWVRENAAAFGGDAENITLFGISAGAKNISALLTLPEMQELCQKVILESGATQTFRTAETADAVARRYMKVLGVNDPSELLTLSAEELVLGQARFCDNLGSIAVFGPVVDRAPFSTDWLARWERGEAWKGSALIGGDRHEQDAAVRSAQFAADSEGAVRQFFGTNAPAVIARAGKLADGQNPDREIWTRVLSDFIYRSHTDRLARRLARSGSRVWMYSFEYPPARHGMGFHFIMQEPDPIQEAEAAKLAERMHTFICRFICTGNPEISGLPAWPPLAASEKQKMAFYSADSASLIPLEGDSLDCPFEYGYEEVLSGTKPENGEGGV